MSPCLRFNTDFRPESADDASQRLGVGNLVETDAAEAAIDDIGAHLAFQDSEAPIADVLEDKQPQHDLGGSGRTSLAARAGMATTEGFVERGEQAVVVEETIGAAHPGLVEIERVFREERLEEAPLGAEPQGQDSL